MTTHNSIVNSLFDIERIKEGVFSQKPNFNYPVMDAYSIEKEGGNHFVYEIAIPGIDPEDITIELNDERGFIRVSQNSEQEDGEDKNYYIKRIGKRKFDIGLHLPSTHKLKENDVSIQHGVLKLLLTPKEDPEKSLRRIKPKVISQ